LFISGKADKGAAGETVPGGRDGMKKAPHGAERNDEMKGYFCIAAITTQNKGETR